MLERSYTLVCGELKRLKTIKKKLNDAITFRNEYVHGKSAAVGDPDKEVVGLSFYSEDEKHQSKQY